MFQTTNQSWSKVKSLQKQSLSKKDSFGFPKGSSFLHQAMQSVSLHEALTL